MGSWKEISKVSTCTKRMISLVFSIFFVFFSLCGKIAKAIENKTKIREREKNKVRKEKADKRRHIILQKKKGKHNHDSKD